MHDSFGASCPSMLSFAKTSKLSAVGIPLWGRAAMGTADAGDERAHGCDLEHPQNWKLDVIRVGGIITPYICVGKAIMSWFLW